MVCGSHGFGVGCKSSPVSRGTGGREEGGGLMVETPDGHHLSQGSMIQITGWGLGPPKKPSASSFCDTDEHRAGVHRLLSNCDGHAQKHVPAVEFGATSIHCRPVPMDTEMDMSEFLMPRDEEEDSRESALCGRKLPLWLGLLLLLAAVGLLVPLIYFAVRANSKACVDGLQAQKECQELNQHLQRQLNQPQEVLHEKEAEAATCKQTVVTLKDSLKKEQARVEELQGGLANLNQQVEDLSEKLRRKSEDSAEDYASSFFDLLFSFFGGVVMTRVVSFTRKCLKK
ncbi:uncharacterized protein LOC128050403 [Budorcas taxicolor]|uniref:uncharacterized protein LOC128050403 n=1 Tax=Budorcas taxicolor TaxID=37181 RepID=UPI002284C50A|nr:uncharacterized protein LOC128050403 [Budorcas taxicolor]